MKDKIIGEIFSGNNSSAAFGLETVAKPNKTAYAFEQIFSHYTTNSQFLISTFVSCHILF